MCGNVDTREKVDRGGRSIYSHGRKIVVELFWRLARLGWLLGACDDFDRDVELWLERLRHRPQITRLALKLETTPPRNTQFMLEPWGGALASENSRF
jgi:hypothetical protein